MCGAIQILVAYFQDFLKTLLLEGRVEGRKSSTTFYGEKQATAFIGYKRTLAHSFMS